MKNGETSPEYQALNMAAGRCRTVARQVGHPRAEQLLVAMAAQCESLAAVFDRQPGLHDYIAELPYRPALDLVIELTRRVCSMTRTAVHRETQDPRQADSSWEEIDCLARRAHDLVADAIDHVPSLNLHTVEGSRAMSRRLIDADRLADAADIIETAISKAQQLPSTDPAVTELASLAARLRQHGARLHDASSQNPDWWDTYFTRAPHNQ